MIPYGWIMKFEIRQEAKETNSLVICSFVDMMDRVVEDMT